MGKFIGLVSLVVTGVIVADFLIHPQGTAAIATGATQIATPTYAALLGQ